MLTHTENPGANLAAVNADALKVLMAPVNISGMPLEWVSVRDVIKLYYLDQVAYTCGDIVHRAYGGPVQGRDNLERGHEQGRRCALRGPRRRM